MNDFVDPLDRTHLDSLAERDAIRWMIAPLIAAARHWQPRPCPDRQEFP